MGFFCLQQRCINCTYFFVCSMINRLLVCAEMCHDDDDGVAKLKCLGEGKTVRDGNTVSKALIY